MTTRVVRILFPAIVACLVSAPAHAQDPQDPQEGKLAAEMRLERERFGHNCDGFDLKKFISCASTLITDHPFHIAVGSLAPQNGFGFGLAFVHPQWKPNDDWRINFSADGVATPSGGWRIGAYTKFVYTNVPDIGVVGAGQGTEAADALPRPYPTISLYAQATSLPKLLYFGLGNDTTQAGRTAFSMRQTVIGSRVVWPFARSGFWNRLNLTALGELNGRWVDVGGSTKGDEVSIDSLYTDATAPGLTSQPATLQFGESVRVAPTLGQLQLIYTGGLQQYVAPSDSSSSFRRWTLDLRHDFSLWKTRQRSAVQEFNGPNECATTADRPRRVYGCPDPTLVTTNRVGTVSFRALVSKSGVSDDSRVPFYFQRTIGGSDIDGERLVASYDDYRFRAPNLMVLQETFEHVIWGPIGAFAAAEQGRVALIDDPFGNSDFKNTFGAGLTLRAGGIPLATIWVATGGPEGNHFTISVNTSLLGGSARPSLR